MSENVSHDATDAHDRPAGHIRRQRGISVDERKTDRRVARTRDRLGDALIELMQQQPFDSIRVQDILDRAGVGRATFYLHYRDKDDLFISDVDDFFEHLAFVLSRKGDRSERVAPVREFFSHIAEARHLYDTLVATGRIQDIMELGEGHLARGIAGRIAALPRGAHLGAGRRVALSEAFAGALFALLSGWLHRGMRESPAEMDALFHRLVWSGVDSAEP